MEIKNEIMEKVREKEDYLSSLKRCLAASFCPKCGGKLTRSSDAIGTEYSCSSCIFTHAE